MKKTYRFALVACITAAILGSGAAGAQAASTYLYPYVYLQEKNNWCWVATTKSLINYKKGTNPSQCTVYKRGKGGTTCPENTATLATVRTALINSSFSYPGNYTHTQITYGLIQNNINSSRPVMLRWGWHSTGGSTGHMVLIRGFDTSGSKVNFIDPTMSSYQENSYTWMKSGGGHTWTHTLEGIIS